MLYPWRRRRCQRRRPDLVEVFRGGPVSTLYLVLPKKRKQQQPNIKYSETDDQLVIDQYMTK